MRCSLYLLTFALLPALLIGCATTPGEIDEELSDSPVPIRPMAELQIEPEEVWLNRMPGPDAPADAQPTVAMTMKVTWGGDSPWEGSAPSSQIYDFVVSQNGNEIWRWSTEQVFAQAITPITVPANGALTYTETWTVDPAAVQPGKYTVTGYFIPAQIETSAPLEISVAQ